jgi:hypothetical protein
MIIDKLIRKSELSQTRDHAIRRRSIDLVAAPLQTRRHRAIVVVPDALAVA